MGVAVTITRLEHSVPELRGMAARSADGTVACRLLAIAHVLEGASRAEAAALCGMDRQTLRDWVQRFNTEGIAGLANRTSPGRNPALSVATASSSDRAFENSSVWRVGSSLSLALWWGSARP